MVTGDADFRRAAKTTLGQMAASGAPVLHFEQGPSQLPSAAPNGVSDRGRTAGRERRTSHAPRPANQIESMLRHLLARPTIEGWRLGAKVPGATVSYELSLDQPKT